jgi:xylose isomerase
MRTYLILREKAERFRTDPEIQAALTEAMVGAIHTPAIAGPVDAAAIDGLRRASYDLDAFATRGYGNERLDQLVTELIMGVR